MEKIDTGTEQLLCNVNESVATLSFNRPEKLNALGDNLTPALREMLLQLESNPEVRVVVITGIGKAFCAGGDVKGMIPKTPDERSIGDRIRDLQNRQQNLTLRLYELNKPTIAALPGVAAGAGMSIALACDLRIGATSAYFVSGFSNIGLSGDYGGSWHLAQLIGPAKAKELYFTSRRVQSEEALRLGLFNEVVADNILHSYTQNFARKIASGPPQAILYMKQNINRALKEDFRTCLDWEADRLVRAAQTEDHIEAINAFVEKRSPKFHGR